MRASRLVSLLLLLQSRGGMTASELARELEVSVRTIHRDVEALGAAGVPIYADRGPHGGIRLVDGYRTRLTGMTSEEADALFLSGLPGPAAELGLGTVVAAARLKVLAALPTELRGRASRLLERFHLDAAGWFRAGEDVPHLAAIAQCVWDGRRLELDYARSDTIVTRTLDPLGLVLKAGVWYLVARQGRELRTFKLAAIQTLERLTEPFVRPRRFDLVAYWAEATRRFEESVYRGVATLRVSPAGLARLRRFGPLVADAADRASGAADARGWRRVTVPIESVEHAADEMLRLGAEAEVIEPEAFEALSGFTSLAFPRPERLGQGETWRVAVKVIDPRGNEGLRVLEVK